MSIYTIDYCNRKNSGILLATDDENKARALWEKCQNEKTVLPTTYKFIKWANHKRVLDEIKK